MAVWIYSDACTTGAGLEAVASFGRAFTVQLTGDAHPSLIRCPAKTNEIFGLELS